ncbi:aldehyde dehydrogenase family protein [Nocardia sp. NPDC058480]|uniref:aldehyde dehydrogenase family protein n=1 Tax=Nocardia sp. NPDC058480 TaxID=3346522 RepID=UPI003656760D
MTTTLTFDVHSPATGALVGSYPSHDESAVAAAVERAHGAAIWWRAAGFDERARRLDRWRTEITRGRDELARVMSQEMGKPHSDADLGAASDAALWGGMANAGQTCLGVERVYVHTDVYDRFLTELLDRARELRAGPGPQKIGPITMPKQLAVIQRHIEDAIARGGRALLGGPDAIDGQFVQPTILVDVPHDSTAVTEETFGPTLVVTRVASMDEAIERVNDSEYGLGATVFARRDGDAIADRIEAGATSINAFVAHATIPALPLGGVGASGFGRVHGPDGLREFTYAKATTRQRFSSPLALTTFTRSTAIDTVVDRLVSVLHGRIG